MSSLIAQNLVGGHWTGQGAEIIDSIDPANQATLGQYHAGGGDTAGAAIEAARIAFKTTDWRHQPKQRASVLLEYADRIQGDIDALASLLCAENGKLLSEARGELMAAVSELRYYAGLARNIFGRNIELEPGLHSTLVREPMGVAGIIVPWNAPAILLVRSLAPAMAAGCASVVKTAPQTALFSARLFQLLSEVEALPAGVVNQFTEQGSAGAEVLVKSDAVDVISYTGSTEVGKAIMASAASTVKRLNLELGGSAPCIVFADADIHKAASALVHAGMAMAGQHCCSATRILVHRSKLDEVVAAISKKMANLKLGRGSDPSTDMGPMIEQASQQRMLDLVNRSSQTDEVICGGGAPGGALEQGFFVEPTLVHASNPRSVLYQGEVFGPLLACDSFEDEAEAVAKANDSRYGLAGSIWSEDLRLSQRVAHQLDIGTIWINSHLRTFPEIENGGYKQSGIGRLHGLEGLDEFLQTKHISWSTRF